MKAAAHTPHSRLSSEATCLTEMVSVSMMGSTAFILRDRELPTMFIRRHRGAALDGTAASVPF